MNTIHLEFEGQNARLALRGLPAQPAPKLIKKTSAGPVERVSVITGLKPVQNPDAQSLIAGDPEIDPDTTGVLLADEILTGVYTPPGSREPAGNFELLEIVTDPQGNVTKTRAPQRGANINTNLPVKITKLFDAAQALTRFVFKATHQIIHQDGLTREFLHKLARKLETEKKVAALGAGLKGNLPLILRNNGLPVRGFLTGQTKGDAYKVLLILTDTELRNPAPQ